MLLLGCLALVVQQNIRTHLIRSTKTSLRTVCLITVTGAQVLFTPHLAPMNRGILATCYARPTAGTTPTTASLLATLARAYAKEPLVVVGQNSPSTKATLGTNVTHITARYDQRTGYVVVLSALDNLAKGASGGAVQAANVALGLNELDGLSMVGMYP